jgi:hypothetical protein
MDRPTFWSGQSHSILVKELIGGYSFVNFFCMFGVGDFIRMLGVRTMRASLGTLNSNFLDLLRSSSLSSLHASSETKVRFPYEFLAS